MLLSRMGGGSLEGFRFTLDGRVAVLCQADQVLGRRAQGLRGGAEAACATTATTATAATTVAPTAVRTGSTTPGQLWYQGHAGHQLQTWSCTQSPDHLLINTYGGSR